MNQFLFLDDSCNKQCDEFDARSVERARRMEDLVHEYERPYEEIDTSPGDMMSNKEYYDQTQLIRVAFQNRSQSILKLTGAMIPLTVQPGSS